MAYEARQQQYQTEIQLQGNLSANFAGRGQSPEQSSRGPNQHRHFSSNNQNRGPPRGRGQNNRGPNPPNYVAPPRGNSGRPECQICKKEGHTAVKCWYRMDPAYQGDSPSAAVASTTSYKIDPNWYSDTGATDHITSDLDCLAVREQYHGAENVHVLNGAGLQIRHIGHSSINTATRPLALNNVLHVPHISKHLLSVHKLT